jgi:hypothetical protein
MPRMDSRRPRMGHTGNSLLLASSLPRMLRMDNHRLQTSHTGNSRLLASTVRSLHMANPKPAMAPPRRRVIR